MKSVVFGLAAVCAISLAGCQSGGVNEAASSRSIEVMGGQSRVTASIPANEGAASAPYSLSGSASPAGSGAGPINFVGERGYQAR